MNTRYDPYYPTSYKRENPAGNPPTKNNPPRPQAPMQPSPFVKQKNTSMSVGNWVGTLLLTAIPVLNIILMFYWAFAKKTKPSKKSWARAVIVIALICIIVSGAVFGLMVMLGVNIANSFFEGLFGAIGDSLAA